MPHHKTSPEEIRRRLATVEYSGSGQDLVALGIVGAVTTSGDATGAQAPAVIELRLPGGVGECPETLRAAIEGALGGLPSEFRIVAPEVTVEAGPSPAAGQTAAPARRVLAVSSAKGGVGKSTVAANLAVAFAGAGYRTGLLDADVHGPTLPIMMGADERPRSAGGARFHPVERHGVACMSMGFFLDEGSPVIWRGPMVAGLIQQFLRDCAWGDLDLLIVDLPPGTGDAQLTLAQEVRLDGAVVVTTPQTVAVRDVERGISMFERVGVPILAVVENMSVFHCPGCGQPEHLFGHGAGRALAEQIGAPFTFEVPLEPEVGELADLGRPIVVDRAQSGAALALAGAARTLAAALGLEVAAAGAGRA